MNKSNNISEDLAVWFGKKKKPKGSSQPKGPWVNICKTNKDGSHPPCGRSDSDGDGKKDGAYPKCRAVHVAAKMSDSAKKKACSQKRRAEKKNPKIGKGNTPTMVSHKNLKEITMKRISEDISRLLEKKGGVDTSKSLFYIKESNRQRVVRLTESELYEIIRDVKRDLNESKNLEFDSTIKSHPEWSKEISKGSFDDFKYVHTDDYMVAVDSQNEYLGHWDHKKQMGYFDEMDELSTETLSELGITTSDKQYQFNEAKTKSKRKSKKKKSKKRDTTLCARGKRAAQAKYDVYPSAYANGYAVQVCKGKMPGLDGKMRCSGKFCK